MTIKIIKVPGISFDKDFGIGIIEKGLNGQYRESCKRALHIADKIRNNDEKILLTAWNIAKPVGRAQISLAALILWLARGREVYDAIDGVRTGKVSLKKCHDLIEIINNVERMLDQKENISEKKLLSEFEDQLQKNDFQPDYNGEVKMSHEKKDNEIAQIEELLDDLKKKKKGAGSPPGQIEYPHRPHRTEGRRSLRGKNSVALQFEIYCNKFGVQPSMADRQLIAEFFVNHRNAGGDSYYCVRAIGFALTDKIDEAKACWSNQKRYDLKNFKYFVKNELNLIGHQDLMVPDINKFEAPVNSINVKDKCYQTVTTKLRKKEPNEEFLKKDKILGANSRNYKFNLFLEKNYSMVISDSKDSKIEDKILAEFWNSPGIARGDMVIVAQAWAAAISGDIKEARRLFGTTRYNANQWTTFARNEEKALGIGERIPRIFNKDNCHPSDYSIKAIERINRKDVDEKTQADLTRAAQILKEAGLEYLLAEKKIGKVRRVKEEKPKTAPLGRRGGNEYELNKFLAGRPLTVDLACEWLSYRSPKGTDTFVQNEYMVRVLRAELTPQQANQMFNTPVPRYTIIKKDGSLPKWWQDNVPTLFNFWERWRLGNSSFK